MLLLTPEIEFTELYRCAIGIDFEAMKDQTLAPEHLQLVNITNGEDAIPEGEVDVTQCAIPDTENAIELTEA